MRNSLGGLILIITAISVFAFLSSFDNMEKDSLEIITGAVVNSEPISVGTALSVAFIKVLGTVRNPKPHAITGYLALKIQKYVPCSSDPWIDVHVVAIEAITIMPGGSISLEELWEQGGGYMTTKKGTFRVYAEFKYNGNVISDNFEFTVKKPSEVISPCVYFDNLTIQNQEEEDIEGFLTLIIQKMSNFCAIPIEWTNIKTIVKDEVYIIPAKSSINLNEIIENKGGFETTEDGTYRIYAEFKLDSKFLTEADEFFVGEPTPFPCPPQSCLDSDEGINFNIRGGAIGNTSEKIDSGEIFLGIGLQPTIPLPADISAYMSYSIYYDHCINNKNLSEIYCEDLILKQINHKCIFNCYDGACEFNLKDKSKYAENEVFIVNNEWKDIAVLTPVANWIEDSETHQYERIIYNLGNEQEVVSQLKNLNPERITIIGDTPQLDNLLLTNLTNFDSNKLQRTSPENFFSYWSTIKGVVYVEDNEISAQQAAEFASSINAPLVIQGTSSDTFNTFLNKYVICVGDGLSKEVCDEYKK